MTTYLLKAVDHYRPRHGWLAFIFLPGVMGCLLLAVVEVDWAPGSAVVAPLVLIGFFFTHWLANRVQRPTLAWLIIAATGAVLAILFLSRLWPLPDDLFQLPTFSDFLAALLQFWRQQLALFFDRLAGWVRAVTGGGSSTETIAFVFGLAFAGWLLAAFLNWSAYRLRRPLLGLTVVGVGLALNTFYGQSGIHWVVMYVGLAVTASTYLDYSYREDTWEKTGVDYSSEVRTDLLAYVAGVSIGIMTLAMAIPTINVRAIAEAFQRQPVVVEAEKTLERAFAGVSVSRPALPPTDEGAPDPSRLPRGFLLGYPPELSETIVMTATLGLPDDETVPGINSQLATLHWRSISYEVYTGQGWERSTTEREEFFPTGALITPPDTAALTEDQVVTLNQAVDWVFDNRRTRYTVGIPVRFSHDTAVFWRGLTDMIGVQGRNNPPRRYFAASQVALPSPEVLQAARLEDVPPEILARYTALPDTVPARVVELARQVGGLDAPDLGDETAVPVPTPAMLQSVATIPTPFDQAQAIEAFLHQYPYTLDVIAPPPDADLVDYFLFDLQRGYCDYFASAMVVMARAIGLPARLAAGYLQQPADDDGVQTIRQANAHSWAEVYFAGIGWVEFEPTPAFAVPTAPTTGLEIDGPATPPVVATIQPVDIPERPTSTNMPWLSLLGIVLLLVVAWRLWGRRWLLAIAGPSLPLDDIQLAYARLQERAADLAYPKDEGQTPFEFAAGFSDYLRSPLFPTDTGQATLIQDIDRLTRHFNARQYGRDKTSPSTDDVEESWDQMRRQLRRLVWRRRLNRFGFH